MTHFWFGACAYLIFSAVALLQADIRIQPGSRPGPVATAWAVLCFALSHPARTALLWIGARARNLMQ